MHGLVESKVRGRDRPVVHFTQVTVTAVQSSLQVCAAVNVNSSNKCIAVAAANNLKVAIILFVELALGAQLTCRCYVHLLGPGQSPF